jgi:hypothetical protein
MLDDYKTNRQYNIKVFINDVGDYEDDWLGPVIIIEDK